MSGPDAIIRELKETMDRATVEVERNKLEKQLNEANRRSFRSALLAVGTFGFVAGFLIGRFA